MGLHVLAVDEAEHVDARAEVGGADGGVAADGLAAQDATGEVNHLQGGFADVADDPFAAVEEGERLGAGCVLFDAGDVEHQAEAVDVVARRCLEGVERHLQQVDVVTRHIVNQVQVAGLHVLSIDADGVGTVALGLEVDRHFAVSGAADHSEVFVALRDVELGALSVELELGQLTAFVEADDGAVDDGTTALAEVHGKVGTLMGSLGAEGQGFAIFFCDNEEALHSFNSTIACIRQDFGTVFVHNVEVAVDISSLAEGVTHEVPAGEGGVVVFGQCDSTVSSVRNTREGESGVLFAGIEVALACSNVEMLGLVIAPFLILF